MYVNESVKNTKRIFPMQGRYGYLRLDMNENPEGLPNEFVRKVLAEITPEFLATYPEPNRFTQKYADYIGLDVSQVLATNGSDMAIRYLLEVFGERGKDVVTVSPSFEMYWVNCSILGLNHVPISYDRDLCIDTNNILNAITADTRIVVLLNPNNPTGDAYSIENAERIVKRAAEVGALVIIDEAYHYFYEQSFVGFVKKYTNVAVLRTFSKLFSLPACRLGVIIASPKIVEYVKNAKLTFDVNSIALLFGERILDEPPLIETLIKTERDGKAYAVKQLQDRGYDYRECKGNYILIRTNKEPKQVTESLEKEHKILVHAYSNELLREYIRITTGSVKVMQTFFKAFLAIDGR